MLVEKGFILNVWLSKDYYKSKPISDDYKKMKWNNVTLSLEEFISYIKSGYSYCHIYRGNRRMKTEFMYSQVVSIDVDDTDVPLLDFIKECTLLPTFGYETFSNGSDGLYSYRLVFVFEEKLSASEYQSVYDRICNICNLTDTKDHCWKNRSRLGQCAGGSWDTFDAAKLMIFS